MGIYYLYSRSLDETYLNICYSYFDAGRRPANPIVCRTKFTMCIYFIKVMTMIFHDGDIGGFLSFKKRKLL